MVRLETELLDSLMNLLGKKNKKTQLTEKELNDIEKYRDENGFINLVDVNDFDEMKRIIDLVDKKNELEEEETMETPEKDCDIMKYIIDLVGNNNEIDDENKEYLNNFVKGLTDDLLKFTGVNNAKIKFETPNKSIHIEANEGEEPKFSVTTSASTCNDKPSICKCDSNDFVWKTGFCQCNSDDLKLQPELCDCGKPKSECGYCDSGTCCEPKHHTCETKNNNKIENRKVVFQPNEQALFELEDDEDISVVVVYNAGGMFNAQFYNAVMHICELEHFKYDDIYSENDVNALCADKVVLLPNAWGKIYESVADTFAKQIMDGQEVYIINPDSFEIKRIMEPLELWDYAMNNVQEEIINDYGRY